MKIRTSKLIGPALDWAVAECEKIEIGYLTNTDGTLLLISEDGGYEYEPSTDWLLGGPIIERERISIVPALDGGWMTETGLVRGPTALITAMRCYVTNKLGDKVEIPNELTK
jgi:hypothetical protein